MTEQQSGQTEAKLRPLDFKPFQVEGPITAYQALVKDDSAPGSPEFALTVSIASSIFKKAEKDFLVFLRKMTASFTLLSRADSGEGESDDEGDSDDEKLRDIGTQIQIEPSLVSIGIEGLFTASVTVQTSLGPNDSVGPYNNNHYWTARGTGGKHAKVTSNGGTGRIWAPKRAAIDVDPRHPGCLKARKVTVHSDKGMNYNFDGNFNGPYDP